MPITLNGDTGITTPTEQVATTIGVGNATPSTSGAGITFPATQSASTDANTLDDYEEGTWTPSQGAGLTVVGAFSSNGFYTKIGRNVTVLFYVAGATSVAVSAAGVITSNLPFSVGLSTPTGTHLNGPGTAGGIIWGGSTSVWNLTTLAASSSISCTLTYMVA
jgi:hypothetical protein